MATDTIDGGASHGPLAPLTELPISTELHAPAVPTQSRALYIYTLSLTAVAYGVSTPSLTPAGPTKSLAPASPMTPLAPAGFTTSLALAVYTQLALLPTPCQHARRSGRCPPSKPIEATFNRRADPRAGRSHDFNVVRHGQRALCGAFLWH